MSSRSTMSNWRTGSRPSWTASAGGTRALRRVGQPRDDGAAGESPFARYLPTRDLAVFCQRDGCLDGHAKELRQVIGRQHFARLRRAGRAAHGDVFAEEIRVAVDKSGEHFLLWAAELQCGAAQLAPRRGRHAGKYRDRFLGPGESGLSLYRHILISK